MRTLHSFDRIERRIFVAEYLDWFQAPDFAYVLEDPGTYEWATGTIMQQHIWFLGFQADESDDENFNHHEEPDQIAPWPGHVIG